MALVEGISMHIANANGPWSSYPTILCPPGSTLIRKRVRNLPENLLVKKNRTLKNKRRDGYNLDIIIVAILTNCVGNEHITM